MSPARAGAGGRFPRQAPRGERGIALLVAILLVALGTIIAATIAYENAMTARRGSASYAFDEALLVAEGAETVAAYGLRQLRQNEPRWTYRGQGWEQPVGPFEIVPGVMLQASLEDLTSRFNLNNIVGQDNRPDPVQLQAFTKLLDEVGLETKWAGYVADWISSGVGPSGSDGAKDSVYMGESPPYRTASRYITSTTELLALPGFGRERYLKLAPYVTALPYRTKLNVCTASGPVLDAFLGSTSEYTASVDENRANLQGCFPTVDYYQRTVPPAMWNGPDKTHPSGVSQWVKQTSNYFRLTSFITIGSAEFNLYSLLYQDDPGVVRPIQRSFTPD